jgi:hypothetical protein
LEGHRGIIRPPQFYIIGSPNESPGAEGRMIRIAITPAAFDAVAATLVLGTVAVEPERVPAPAPLHTDN